MKKIIKFLSCFIFSILLFSLVSCTSETSSEIDSYFPVFPSLPNTMTEDVIVESTSKEDVENEDIKIENQIKERTMQEILQLEVFKREDVQLEHISIEIVNSFEELDNHFSQCEFGVDSENDYEMAKYYFKEGMKIVAAEVIVDVASSLISIVCQNYIGALDDLADAAIMVGTTTYTAFVEGIINAKLSADAGNDIDTILCDALTGATQGFYYAAVATEVLLTAKAIVNLVKSGIDLVKNLKKKATKIPTSDGGYVKNGKYFDSNGDKYSINNFGEIYDSNGHYYKTINDFNNLDAADISSFDVAKRSLVSGDVETSQGNKAYRIEKYNDAYTYQKYAKNNDGERVLSGEKMPIDENGWIYKKNIYNDYVPTYKINLDSNSTSYVADLHKSTEKGITFDTDFNLTNKTEIIGNKKIIYSNADESMPIAYKNLDTNYIFDYNTKNAIGFEDADGMFDVSWQKGLDIARKKGTDDFRKITTKLMKEYPDSTKYFNKVFSEEQISYIIKTGKLPTGYEIHHTKSVAQNPTYASDVSIMEILSKEDHRIYGHGGDYRNPGVATKNYFNILDIIEEYGLKLNDLIN